MWTKSCSLRISIILVYFSFFLRRTRHQREPPFRLYANTHDSVQSTTTSLTTGVFYGTRPLRKTTAQQQTSPQKKGTRKKEKREWREEKRRNPSRFNILEKTHRVRDERKEKTRRTRRCDTRFQLKTPILSFAQEQPTFSTEHNVPGSCFSLCRTECQRLLACVALSSCPHQQHDFKGSARAVAKFDTLTKLGSNSNASAVTDTRRPGRTHMSLGGARVSCGVGYIPSTSLHRCACKEGVSFALAISRPKKIKVVFTSGTQPKNYLVTHALFLTCWYELVSTTITMVFGRLSTQL